MLGIPDPWVLAGYLLTILSTCLCIGYGMINWNKEEELSPVSVDKQWEQDEIKIEENEEGL
jgi:hypothetical protein